MRDLQDQADELADQWVNGNLSDVADAIAAKSAPEAAALAVLVADRIRLRPAGANCAALVRLLAQRA